MREERTAGETKVWDAFVRTFHWSVSAAFFVAYATEDDLLSLHVWAGYAVGGLVALRIAWGFVGPKHARFRDFVYSPFAVWRYLLDLLTFRARRYLGHSPAGGAMAVALMLGMLAVVWSGLEVYAIKEGAGPLAAAPPAAWSAAGPEGPRLVLVNGSEGGGKERRKGGKRAKGDEDFWEDLHEGLANFVLFLVILHLAGVAFASYAHKENLVRGMITGMKRKEEEG